MPGALELQILGPWIGVLFYLLGGVLVILNIFDKLRRKPSVDVDLGSINSRLGTVEAEVKRKQDAAICQQLHKDWERELSGIGSRHGSHEDKISRQIGDIHKRIDNQTAAIAATGARLETFMTEIRSWRNNHDQKRDT